MGRGQVEDLCTSWHFLVCRSVLSARARSEPGSFLSSLVRAGLRSLFYETVRLTSSSDL